VATFAQLKTRAQNLALNDDDTEAGLHVNDALDDIVVSAQLKVTQVSKTLTVGVSVYDISSDWSISDFGALQYLEYLGLGSTYSYILEPSSADELLALNATNPIGATRKYAFLGLDTIRLWPVPQQTGDTLKIYYAQTSTDLVDSSDVPADIPSQWHWLIAIGAAARLADAVGEDQNLSNALDAKFQAGMDRFQKWLTRRQGRTAKTIQTGYLRNPRRPFHDNSTYYSFTQRQS
jgi:hypothetical protein